MITSRTTPPRSMLVAYLMWTTTGFFGGHRLYLGRYTSALPMFIMAVYAIPKIQAKDLASTVHALETLHYSFFDLPDVVVFALFFWWVADFLLLPSMVQSTRIKQLTPIFESDSDSDKDDDHNNKHKHNKHHQQQHDLSDTDDADHVKHIGMFRQGPPYETREQVERQPDVTGWRWRWRWRRGEGRGSVGASASVGSRVESQSKTATMNADVDPDVVWLKKSKLVSTRLVKNSHIRIPKHNRLDPQWTANKRWPKMDPHMKNNLPVTEKPKTFQQSADYI